MLEILKHVLFPGYDHEFQPKAVMIDFEMAMVKAVQQELPGSEIRGCYFHFMQCLWRKVQELELVALYKGGAFKNYLKSMATLPLLPQDRLEEAMDLISEEFAENVRKIITCSNFYNMFCFLQF